MKKRYWRRSSRWRAALKRAKTWSQKVRLHRLAYNRNPLVYPHDLTGIMQEDSWCFMDRYLSVPYRSPWIDLIDMNAVYPDGMGDAITKLAA